MPCTSEIRKKRSGLGSGDGLPLAWSSGARCARSRIPCAPWWCRSWGRRLGLMPACRECDEGIDDESRAMRQAAGSNWTPMTPGGVEATLEVPRAGGDDRGYSTWAGSRTSRGEAAAGGQQHRLAMRMRTPCRGMTMLHGRQPRVQSRGRGDDVRCRWRGGERRSCGAAAATASEAIGGAGWQQRRGCAGGDDDGRWPRW